MIEPLALILAGGRSTRMDGASKADLTLGGERLIDRCVDRLLPQVRDIAVNTNEPILGNWTILPDTMSGHLGPLAGILAGLEWATKQNASHIVSVAVDTPFFPCDLVPHLLMAADDHSDGLTIAMTPDGEHGTFGLWPVSLIDPLSAFLASGGRKVRTFTQGQNAALAPFPDTTPPAFFNINTPDDLTQAQSWV
ncbi:molybdenum cofactor guanylyltransferase MobA [Octadecabacter sp. 1_MG-2023]|uniref:molybdenum cofactor guanylyltransferase MobA n=1 Tax=unclassified Octadecabacter TaxID=196158 RepID=UPI001C0A4528|nr:MULTISPECIES: molybdenum cofactor guanylyltransferase MobA [unclassified Octadecabacter]MBU2994150.1 molybdenum cofactor guanylyltransferase [Octadecabacter sp. B2R22]MDO6734561.1 molybdenum cofactor guanylyltransferase MobA [Octadecabacter sp. 1_MG-2023]